MKRLVAIFAIAGNTFREAIRNKVLASVGFFALILYGTSVVLGQMSLHHEVRVTTDFGLYFSTLFGVVITIYAMVTLLHTEISRRTIYTLLSKPIARWEFFLGKYFGVAGLSAAITLIMYLLTTGLIFLQGGEATGTVAIAFVAVYLQLLIVAAITGFLSTISSPLLSGISAATLFICGNLITQISAVKALLVGPGSLAKPIVDGVMLALPHFEALNFASYAAREHVVPGGLVLDAVLYSAFYATAVLLLGIATFARKDFQ